MCKRFCGIVGLYGRAEGWVNSLMFRLFTFVKFAIYNNMCAIKQIFVLPPTRQELTQGRFIVGFGEVEVQHEPWLVRCLTMLVIGSQGGMWTKLAFCQISWHVFQVTLLVIDSLDPKVECYACHWSFFEPIGQER